MLCLIEASSHFHPKLTPSHPPIPSPDDGSAVFVPDVGHHIHLRRPELKLSLPVNDRRQRCAHQERALTMALGGEVMIDIYLHSNKSDTG